MAQQTTISTDLGDYVIYQAADAIESVEGDVKAGDWLYQPADYSGDIFSPSYPTRDEAEAAALEYVANEIDAQNADR